MKLAQYLADNRLTQTEFAKRIRVSDATMHRLVTEKREPDREVMARIYAETQGAVTANDFFDQPTVAA